MAALISAYDQGNLHEFAGLDIDSIRWLEIEIVYFCTFGRNARHSTWIHRYYELSMYYSLRQATTYAEQQRNQGSVFYIKELPALHINGGAYRFVITQIDSRCPLVYYRPRSSSQETEGALNLFSRGRSLLEAVESFEIDADMWWKRQPVRDSVIILNASCSDSLPDYPEGGFRAWRLRSVGREAPLLWAHMNNPVTANSINKLTDLKNT